MSTNIYCTYLTIYSGNKLPPFYIGSSTISKINNGYHGSVKSKKYRDIWEKELAQNPSVFKTIKLTTHSTRQEALLREASFQKSLKVVNSCMYINESIAAPNGYFGRSILGADNPFYGKKHSDNSKILIGSYHNGQIISEDQKEQIRKANKKRLGKKFSLEIKNNMKIVRNKRSPDVDKKTSETMKALWKDPSQRENFLKNRKYATGKKWYHQKETGKTIQCVPGTQPNDYVPGRV